MVFIIKNIIALILTGAFASLYGYLSSGTASNTATVLLGALYSIFTIAIYIYTYDTVSNNLKRLGVLLTLVINAGGLYLAWTIWAVIRSDYQLYLFTEPIALWNNILSMAADTNVILVHSRYPDSSDPEKVLYCFWIFEFFVTVAFPTLFALQAITAYSDEIVSAEELHHKFDSSAINDGID